MKSFTAHFVVKDGFPEYKNPEYLINLQKFEGCSGVLQVKRKWNKRSLNQNAWMWACFEIIGDYIGENKNTVHRIMTGLFAPKKEIKVGKRKVSMPIGTSEMSKGEMVEFMLNVSSEAGQMGITLPDPEEYNQMINEAVLL